VDLNSCSVPRVAGREGLLLPAPARGSGRLAPAAEGLGQHAWVLPVELWCWAAGSRWAGFVASVVLRERQSRERNLIHGGGR